MLRRILVKLAIGTAILLAVLLVSAPFAIPAAVEYVLSSKIAELGFFPDVDMSLGYCWRNGPGLEGKLRVALRDTPWRVSAEFGASCCEWAARVHLPETAFDETDPTLVKLLRQHPVTAVSNLTFSGSVSLDAKVERTFTMPVPVWSVKVPLKNVSASALLLGDTPRALSFDGFSLTAAASGIARHVDVAPLHPCVASMVYNGLSLTNFHATVRASERILTISEATAGFCGGSFSVYSLLLNPKTLNAGFTLFMDDIDAGQALRALRGFRGEASGRLHGKVRLFVREGGKELRLSKAFLYSTPGETGKIRMENPELVTDNLELAGIGKATRDNVANALTDLDYDVLRLDLKRTGGSEAMLSTRVRGTATRGETSAPVDITVNFHGEIEQLLNLGLDYSRKLKGLRK